MLSERKRKLSVWSPKAKLEKELFVSLVNHDQVDEVLVRLVDSEGKAVSGGSLIIITPDGYYPVIGVYPATGVAVDGDKSNRMKELPSWPR